MKTFRFKNKLYNPSVKDITNDNVSPVMYIIIMAEDKEHAMDILYNLTVGYTNVYEFETEINEPAIFAVTWYENY